MMKLDSHPAVAVQVTLPKNIDGEKPSFELICTVVADDELEGLGAVEQLSKMITGWSGIEDQKGKPLKYNVKHLPLLLRQPGFLNAFQVAYASAVFAGSEKNL